MTHKELLHLDLNYTHRNLSPGFRLQAFIIGTVFIISSILVLSYKPDPHWLIVLSGCLNLLAGLIAFYYSSRRLTWLIRRYISITDDSVRLKINLLFPRKKYNWKDIEQIEISREHFRIWTDQATKPNSMSLMSVSYDDYQVLYKLVVDLCVEKNIDLA